MVFFLRGGPPALAVVSLLAATGSIGCADATPGELEGRVYLVHVGGAEDGLQVTAALSGDAIPPHEDLVVTVDGSPIAHDASGGSGHIYHGTVAMPEPDVPIGLQIATDEDRAEIAIPMVHPASFIHEVASVEVTRGEALTVAWTEAFPGEEDWIYFRTDGYFSVGLPPDTSGAAPAASGATSVTIPPELIAAWREDFALSRGAVPGPVTGVVGLLRTVIVPASPQLAAGEVVLAVEVDSMPVVLQP